MRRNRSKLKVAGDPEHSPCPHFPACGGCTYLGLSEEAVLHDKEQAVLDALRDVIREDTLWEGILPSPSFYHYRNKMEFSFGDDCKDGPLTLGMHERGSFYNVVSVPDCCIVDDDFKAVLKTTLSFFSPLYEQRTLRYYHRKKQRGYLRHLLVRKAHHTGEVLIGLVTNSYEMRCWEDDPPVPAVKETDAEETLLDAFVTALQAIPFRGKLTGILHIRNTGLSDAIKADETRVLYGCDTITENILDLTFRITPFSFFQTNTASAEVLYEKVRTYVSRALTLRGGDRPRVLYDLYSGTGTITQLMASVASLSVGVELVEEAVHAARENAARNGIGNCKFLAGDVLKVLDELEETPDFIILDPPREGVHPKALTKILSYGVRHIIYVSCKVTSLQRDAVMFHEAGYRMTAGCALDQFPWTAHTEVIACFEKTMNGK